MTERKTYRTINAPTTLLGIDRTVCILLLTLDLCVYEYCGFIYAALTFAIIWGSAYLVQKYDPALLKYLPKVICQKRVYDPFL